MSDPEPTIEPVAKAVTKDRNEDVAEMEPLLVSEGAPERRELTDLVLDLAARSASFRRSLPPSTVTALADLVRSMNCYYSNLIEGHATHPVEIEKAFKGKYSDNPKKRDLQLEATAHIHTQKWIDGGGLNGAAATSQGSIREIHRQFCSKLPPEMLEAKDPESGKTCPVIPGDYRTRDVRVGTHIPVSPGAVPRFMDRFENVYASLNKSDSILSAAAAHHRFAWIHPFLDGNGRVARLMSHATLLTALDTGALWSISRGLARRVDDYKRLLAECDQPRRFAADGRGALSQEALIAFTRFFLEVCIDQVKFMDSLMKPEELRKRADTWAKEQLEEKKLAPKADKVLEALVYRGSVGRGEVVGILNTNESTARKAVASLAKEGVIVSESSRAPLHLAIPARLAPIWMPGLFPEQPLEPAN